MSPVVVVALMAIRHDRLRTCRGRVMGLAAPRPAWGAAGGVEISFPLSLAGLLLFPAAFPMTSTALAALVVDLVVLAAVPSALGDAELHDWIPAGLRAIAVGDVHRNPEEVDGRRGTDLDP